jgi:hypothetical protein
MMIKAEDAAQAALLLIVEELKSIRFRLQEIVESLQPPPKGAGAAVGEEDLDEDLDTATEVRSTIECVLNDDVQPAIRDLRTAAVYRPKNGTPAEERLPRPQEDDARAEEADRRAEEIPAVGGVALDDGQPGQRGQDVDASVGRVDPPGESGVHPAEEPGEDGEGCHARQQPP